MIIRIGTTCPPVSCIFNQHVHKTCIHKTDVHIPHSCQYYNEAMDRLVCCTDIDTSFHLHWNYIYCTLFLFFVFYHAEDMRSLSNGFSAVKKNILNGRQWAKDVEYSGIWCIHQQWSRHSSFLHLDRGSKYVRSWSRQHLELSYSICNISAGKGRAAVLKDQSFTLEVLSWSSMMTCL